MVEVSESESLNPKLVQPEGWPWMDLFRTQAQNHSNKARTDLFILLLTNERDLQKFHGIHE